MLSCPSRIWVCFFMLALQSAIGANVMPIAYSSFQTAPQISTANILASIIGGVLKLPIAKLLNVWGRAEGFFVFVVIYVVGLIILASCNGPNGYAAGYVLYWVGYDAIYLILDVFMADTSGLRNRAFAFGFASTPFICTAFTGSLAAQSFMKMTTWRWAFGAFTLIQPVVFLPLVFVFLFFQRKAASMGLFVREDSGRTTWQSIMHYIHEFDVVGAFLLIASWVIFLLPFSLETEGRAQYKGATFIAMVVVGFCLFFVFAAWEKWLARTHFIRYDLLKKPTVIGACCLAAVLYFSFYAWDLYYYYYVMIVYDLDTSMTGYMTQIYNVGSCFWSVVIGLWFRYTKQFKYTCLFFGLPLMILGAGLMIHFRGGNSDIGYLIMCQIFIAFAGGTLVIGNDMAVMAAADREGVPMMLSLIGLFSSLGGAIGQAVTASINSNIFPEALQKALPDEYKSQYLTIFNGGTTTQLVYPVGSPVRNAIDYAWSQTQKDTCIAATAILALGIPFIAIWKNYKLDKKQNKGVIL
ncbi:Siderochrome iron transporter 2, variant 2 [Monascus purpureus]|nr:Siderochrome iron transporter 2, variant 2 [Monascus purpureus]